MCLAADHIPFLCVLDIVQKKKKESRKVLKKVVKGERNHLLFHERLQQVLLSVLYLCMCDDLVTSFIYCDQC
jgi:hypothetical protein